jgi:probable rRNA maturation factor
VLESLDQRGCELHVVFVGPRTMKLLNVGYRGKEGATDVLSFAYAGPILGEIVIAPAVASENARRWRTTPEAELRMLLVHGILHLLGYDHETDRGEMMRLQRQIVRKMRFVRSVPRLLGS